MAEVEKLEVRVSGLDREKKALEKKIAALQCKVDKEGESLEVEKEVSYVDGACVCLYVCVYVCVCMCVCVCVHMCLCVSMWVWWVFHTST